ncbi:pyridoxamine 5'-phosphate oxidase-related FMN-binding [Methanococcus vannielii SB]|jgi:predicted pyridoxine 5'-phosphate oxidase superfamily flavin-nucleotide-binding protein|uniref:Pyridoxamine 5'-phosphate oxidase-related FMN-binding n=1 Tax=Methanococcus vannielii (strain ATCC 35089 / DSM 1224 / JCM 13029 / OCM 148 / SB) TaxID=406327 RepID=A6USB9_METVS|nr:pyridoxamine 5'-phosphate oxidase family protein [Methanococcus vannielii]ABR55391.1 pyridoxamine 5'-phosphate oxidase-related FMN-binding [Methanococcus vannielii SB]
MVKLTEEMKSALTGLLFLATSSKDGIPNVAPMGANQFVGDKLVISDNFMKKTLENVKENPVVAINLLNCREHPYQYKGKAEIVTSGEYFEKAKELNAVKIPGINAKGALVITITSIYSIKPGAEAGNLIETDD